MKKFIILLILLSLIIISCGGEDQFAAKAYRLRAEQGLKEIRNALSEYKLKYNRYPVESEWKASIKSYFREERVGNPKKLTSYKMLVMSARNDISQVKGIMQALKRQVYWADSSMQNRIMEYLRPIDSSLALANYEINEAERYEYSDITPQLKSLGELVRNVNIAEKKNDILENMSDRKDDLTEWIDGMKNELGTGDINQDTLNMIVKTLKGIVDVSYKKAAGEKKASYSNIPDPGGQIEILKGYLNPDEDSILINELDSLNKRLNSYTGMNRNIEFYDYLEGLRKKIPASISLFNDYYKNKRENVLNSNRILTSYSALDNLRSLISLYQSKNDSLPNGNLNDIFKEDVDMKEIREDLSSDPYLYKENNGYRLEASAIDREQTEIERVIKFTNTFDELVKKSFSSPPRYETNDSGSTFFIVVKAKDVENTILTSRPKFREKEKIGG